MIKLSGDDPLLHRVFLLLLFAWLLSGITVYYLDNYGFVGPGEFPRLEI